MGSHQSQRSQTAEWLTPPSILNALGEFDLDPCAPVDRPWPTARGHYTIDDDGLSLEWHGRVWCNPPYGALTTHWLDRLAEHGNGTALIFARTETAMFFDCVWGRASALLFLKGRLHFHSIDGTRAKLNVGAPSVLVAYGSSDAYKLEISGIEGKFIRL